MQLLRLLSQVSVLKLSLAILTSILSGFAAMAALICVFESLRRGTLLWWQFAAAAAFAMLCRESGRIILGRLATRAVVRLRWRLVKSVVHVPLLDFERIGSARMLVAFTSDLANVGSAVRNLVSLSSSAAFLLALVGYLMWLTPERATITALLLVLCIGVAVFLRRLEQKRRQSARVSWDRVVHIFTMVLNGVKQLKLNRQLARQVLRAFKDRNSAQVQSGGKRIKQSDLVGTWVQVMFYVILGLAVFGPFGDGPSLRRAYGYGLLALLHIRGPLRSLISDSRSFAEASIALQRITDLGLTLSEDQERESGRNDAVLPGEWRHLELQAVGFRYRADDPTDEFALGPLDLTLHPGEIIFIAGGNGSGKTTFAKILTGLYSPTSGTIRLDGVVVDEVNIRWFRRKFSAVFADFCLFEGVADLRHEDVVEGAERLAVRLKLERWMLAAPDSSAISTTTLSSGERRRVALLMALLEDRPILVFDEWAADQDPRYKDLFYTEILPRIRDSGKLVIVISHDERYFHVADRVLWLERGEPAIWRSPSSFVEPLKDMAGADDGGLR
jgi:putative pyoverdin transport system ATP-binding/permease protein